MKSVQSVHPKNVTLPVVTALFSKMLMLLCCDFFSNRLGGLDKHCRSIRDFLKHKEQVEWEKFEGVKNFVYPISWLVYHQTGQQTN